VALALAQAGQFQEAFRALESQSLNNHIQAIAQVVLSVERLHPDCSVELIVAVANIAGWMLPSWRSLSLGSKGG
jgi:hypothetical protein